VELERQLPHVEPYLRVLRERVPAGAVVIDVGANIGVTAALAAKMVPNARIVAIEPMPRAFECLRRTMAANGLQDVTLLNCAIGTKWFGHLYFEQHELLATSHVTDKPTDSSLRVAVRRLDYIIRRLGLRNVDLIKIDVEGCELDVLRGMRFLPRRMRPLIFAEFNAYALIAQGNVSPRRLLDYVQDRFSDVETANGKRLASTADFRGFLYENLLHRATVEDLIFRPKAAQ
jgi:FkbM family methyltransferase